MNEPAGRGRRTFVPNPFRSIVVAVMAGGLGACGGGGDGGAATSAGSGAAGALVYAHSQVLGNAAAQSLTYVPAVPPSQPVVQAPNAGNLLSAGPNSLTAEYIPPSLSGVRVACVSGNGTSIGVLDAVNPGVVTVSAAVLLGSDWREVDPDAAWAAAAAASERWDGWENCGAKPEGAPFKSSTVTPAVNGGYGEDVVIGNPGTNFTTVHLEISSAEAADMRRSGALTTEDAARPLRITWRVFSDSLGNTVWVERGEPAIGAPSGTRGFITLFLPNRQR